MKLLYFFSHLCDSDSFHHSEINNEGIKIYLTKVDKDISAAPKIPNPDNILIHQSLFPIINHDFITQ